jgi:uncharacterized protein (UPF0333 family)
VRGWEPKSGQTVVEYLLLLLFVVLIAIKVSEFMRNAFKKGGSDLKNLVIERNLNTGIGFK